MKLGGFLSLIHTLQWPNSLSRVRTVFYIGVLFSFVFSTALYAEENEAFIAPLAKQKLLIDLTRTSDGWVAVGERGHILRSADGLAWKQELAPTRKMLTGITHQNGHTWVVGHDAIILHKLSADEKWQEQHLDVELDKPLLNVWFENEVHGFGVGAYGLVLETQDGGATWNQQTVDEDEPHFYAMDREGDGPLYLVGEFGTLYRSDDVGAHWARLESPYEGTFFGVEVLVNQHVVVFGLRGNVFKSKEAGKTWTKIETGTEASLFTALEEGEGALILGGQSGSLLVSSDYADSFTLKNNGTRSAISRIVARDENEYITVGDAGLNALNALHSEQPLLKAIP